MRELWQLGCACCRVIHPWLLHHGDFAIGAPMHLLKAEDNSYRHVASHMVNDNDCHIAGQVV